jgi:hypothetical protein
LPLAPAQRAASCAGRARVCIASGRSLKIRRIRPSYSRRIVASDRWTDWQCGHW